MKTTIRPNHSPQPIYHYTTRDRLESILAEGAIRTATGGIPHTEIPAVWLSTASKWERSACKAKFTPGGSLEKVTLAEMIEVCGGALMRIRINPDLVSLILPNELQRALNMDRKTIKSLVKLAKMDGASPNQWRAVAAPVPVSAFLSIELSHTANPINWVSLEPHAIGHTAG